MPTVTNICDRVADYVGLVKTTSTADRTATLDAVNDAYRMAVMDSACLVGSINSGSGATLTASTADYDPTASPISVTDASRFRYLYISMSGSLTSALTQVTEDYMRSLRAGGAGTTGTPQYYAFPAPNLLLLWPTPATATILMGTYVKKPLALVESGASAGVSETTPSAFDSRFHYDVIASKAASIMLEQAKDRLGRASYHDQKYQAALQLLIAWVEEFGGNVAPSVRREWSGIIANLPDRDMG